VLSAFYGSYTAYLNIVKFQVKLINFDGMNKRSADILFFKFRKVV